MKKLSVSVLTLAVVLAVSFSVAASGTKTKEVYKGDGVKVKTEQKTTKAGEVGKVTFKVKKGAIKDMNIKWIYKMENGNYVTEYNVLENTNKKLLSQLRLTPVQAALIKPGQHKIISTSPFTGQDVENNIKTVILKDLIAATVQQIN